MSNCQPVYSKDEEMSAKQMLQMAEINSIQSAKHQRLLSVPEKASVSNFDKVIEDAEESLLHTIKAESP